MRTATAIEVRKRFGQVLDEASAGQRIVIERAGHPIAALVPLTDLAELDPDQKRRRRLEAIRDVRRMARQHPIDTPDPAALIRDQRAARLAQIIDAARTLHENAE